MRHYLIFLVLTVYSLTSSGQNHQDINTVLVGLSGQSEFITTDSFVTKLLKKGEKTLSLLSEHFVDSSVSRVFSKCLKRYLTHGELAIIIADHIEGMPYFTLTGLQNCTLESCENNPNFIEYYLNFIKFRGWINIFQKRYDKWLTSSDRKKYKKALHKIEI